MAYKRTYKKRTSVKKSPMKKTSLSPNSAIAKLTRKVNSLTKATTRPIYYNVSLDGDLAGTGGTLNSAWEQIITQPTGTVCFGVDGVTGDRARCDWAKIRYEIHMDNLNNEEETCNFTVSCVSFKKQHDGLTAVGNNVNTANGMVFYNPDLIKVHAMKTHTLTMGGVSPGTSGQMIARGYFFIKINKHIHFTTRGVSGAQTSVPSSFEDKIFFLIHTDNTSVDLENPRFNALMTVKWTDLDVNY